MFENEWRGIMVSIVRLLVIAMVICIMSDGIQAQEKVKSARLEITSSLTDKGKRERLRQIYNRFWKETKIPFKCSYLVLHNLSRAGNTIETGEAFDCFNTYLATLEHNRKIQLELAREVEREFGSVYREAFLPVALFRQWSVSQEGCVVALSHWETKQAPN